jgi:hypothetical protein
VEELMRNFILSLEIEKNYDRIMRGVLIVSTVIFIVTFAALLPGILNK